MFAHNDVAEANTHFLSDDNGETEVVFAEAFDFVPRDEFCLERRTVRNAVFVGGHEIVLVKIRHPRSETNADKNENPTGNGMRTWFFGNRRKQNMKKWPQANHPKEPQHRAVGVAAKMIDVSPAGFLLFFPTRVF